MAAPLVNPNSLVSTKASEASLSSRELIARHLVMRKEKNREKKRNRCEAIFAAGVEQGGGKAGNRGRPHNTWALHPVSLEHQSPYTYSPNRRVDETCCPGMHVVCEMAELTASSKDSLRRGSNKLQAAVVWFNRAMDFARETRGSDMHPCVYTASQRIELCDVLAKFIVSTLAEG
jgi:hypothetical protein